MDANMTFCQSCGMPLNNEVLGTEKGGAKSADYCEYCYKDGAFTSEDTMESMIESCAPHCVPQPYPNEETARAEMMKFFPQLKRWKK